MSDQNSGGTLAENSDGGGAWGPLEEKWTEPVSSRGSNTCMGQSPIGDTLPSKNAADAQPLPDCDKGPSGTFGHASPQGNIAIANSSHSLSKPTAPSLIRIPGHNFALPASSAHRFIASYDHLDQSESIAEAASDWWQRSAGLDHPDYGSSPSNDDGTSTTSFTASGFATLVHEDPNAVDVIGARTSFDRTGKLASKYRHASHSRTYSLAYLRNAALPPIAHSMHPFSIVTLAIFIAGYGTARWDLVTRLYELAVFAWDKGVILEQSSYVALKASPSFRSFSSSSSFLCSISPDSRPNCTRESVAQGYLLATSFAAGVPSRLDMTDHDGLMRVFWPTDIEETDVPGVIVGWRNSGLDVVVIAVLQHVEPRGVDNALKAGILFRSAPFSISRIFELCGQPSLHVLGVTNTNSPASFEFDPSWVLATTATHSRVPRIACAKASSVQTILFDRPNAHNMQYMSLKPVPLVLADKETPSMATASDASEGEEEKKERREKRRRQALAAKIKFHSVVSHESTAKDKALDKIVIQINWAWELEGLLQRNVHLVGVRPKRTLSVSEHVVEQATFMRDNALTWLWDKTVLYLIPVVRKVVIFMIMLHRMGAEVLLRVLEWRLRSSSPALKDVSATAQQVEVRLQQFCYWPMQHVKLRLRKNDWKSVTTSHPDYIRFYNSLWLVANDVIIGIALGSYIIENADSIAHRMHMLLRLYSVEALQRSIEWLMGWPAGLKLNKELAVFLGDLFLWVIEYWAEFVEALSPSLPQLVWFIGFSSFAGASMPIALFSDLLSVLTIHIYCFYLAAARIYHWQLTILLSLFQLFRGKKYNVLRNRVDSCDYDLDQLLVGTILFTVLFFLLPTVAVFYLNFAIARMAIISLKAVFDTQLSCLNHFPLFALMLRVKDPRRLPGGIRFELHDTQDIVLIDSPTTQQPTSVINLKPIPLNFNIMFEQYFQMGNRIRKHYLSPRVLFCLLTGRFVPPLHRKNLYSLQYSMLPATRAGIKEMWDALNSLPRTKRPVKVYANGTHLAVPNGTVHGRRAHGRRGAGSH